MVHPVGECVGTGMSVALTMGNGGSSTRKKGVIGQKVCLESRLRPCGVWRFMGSKVGDMTFAPGRNVCLESLSALTAAWVDSRSKVPVPWCHGTAIVPAVRREDEKERHDQRGQDPLAVQGPGMRVEQDARLWHGRARRARVHRLAPVGGHPRATACERPHAAPAQRAWLEPVAAMPDGRAGPRRGAPRRHPPGPQRGRAHRLGRRARARLVRGPARDQRRMDEPDGPHRSNPWPSYATGAAASARPSGTHAWRDEQIEHLYRQAWEYSDEGQRALLGLPARYGTGIDWNESHTSTPWRNTD